VSPPPPFLKANALTSPAVSRAKRPYTWEFGGKKIYIYISRNTMANFSLTSVALVIAK